MEEWTLAGISEGQHGAIARTQLRTAGYGRQWEHREVRAGRLVFATPRVVRIAGTPQTPHHVVMVGVLDAGEGTVASHDTAAWLWGLPGFAPEPVHVTAPRWYNRRPGDVVVHEPRRLLPHHLTVVEGIPVTSVARTLFDLAPLLPPGRLERLVHAVVRRSPGTLPVLHATLRDLARRGRAGIRVMRAILEALPVGSVPADSGTELRFEQALADAGEPPLRRQVDLGGHSFLGRVDYLDDDLALVFEIDSRTFHHLLPADGARDLERDERMHARGLRVVRIDEHVIWRDPDEAVRIVREARRRRRAERSGAGNVRSA